MGVLPLSFFFSLPFLLLLMMLHTQLKMLTIANCLRVCAGRICFWQAKIIMITHAHSDHFQPSTIEQLTSAGTEVIAPADVAATLIGENATYKSITHVLANGQSVAIDGFTIHAVPM